HPRSLRGHHARRSHRGHDAAAGPDQARLRREAAAAPRCHRPQGERGVPQGVRRDLACPGRGVPGAGGFVKSRGRAVVWAWRTDILVAILVAWEYLTGIKAISRPPGLYWIDPFFISRPSAIAGRFVYLMSDNVRLPLWKMALSTVQPTLWGFLVGITSGFVAGVPPGRSGRGARGSRPLPLGLQPRSPVPRGRRTS